MNDIAYRIVRQTLDNVDAPVKGVIIDVVEYEGHGFAYRLYEENLQELSDSNREDLITFVVERANRAQQLSGSPVVIEKVDTIDG